MTLYDHYKNELQRVIDSKTADEALNITAINNLLMEIYISNELRLDQKWALIAAESYRLPSSQSEYASLGFIILSEQQRLSDLYFVILKNKPWGLTELDIAKVFNNQSVFRNTDGRESNNRQSTTMTDLLLAKVLADFQWLSQDDKSGHTAEQYLDVMKTSSMLLRAIDCGALPHLTQKTYTANDANKAAKNLVFWCVQNLKTTLENFALLGELKDKSKLLGKFCASTQAEWSLRPTWENTTRGIVLAHFDRMDKELNPAKSAVTSLFTFLSSWQAPVTNTQPLNGFNNLQQKKENLWDNVL